MTLFGVTRGVASALLAEDGSLRAGKGADLLTRATLLLDLALERQVYEDVDGVVLEPAATGFAPADAFATEILTAPERGLMWWVRRGGTTFGDLVTGLVDMRWWWPDPLSSPRKPRYRAVRPLWPATQPVEAIVAELARFLIFPQPSDLKSISPWSGQPTRVMLTEIAKIAISRRRRYSNQSADSSLARPDFGDAAWLMPEVIEELGFLQALTFLPGGSTGQ